jgi:hypothetical protein
MTYDRSSEFIVKGSKSMIENNYAIKGKPVWVRSPKNAILKITYVAHLRLISTANMLVCVIDMALVDT